MCKVCGCGDGQARIDGGAHRHDHGHDHHHGHGHGHGHDHHDHDHAHHDHDHGHEPHHHHADGTIDFGRGPAGAHVAGFSQSRLVEIEKNILAKNDGYAAENRAAFAERGVLALNLVSSPGAGKTTLLVKTIAALKASAPVAVIEGDQETANDAERIRAAGAPAVQINTGKGCHLDGHMVGHAVEHLEVAEGAILFIENVGNLVCPAGFDLGEAAKVVLLSVTEGDDKPLKYPDMFAASALMLVTKSDLAPYVDFDIARCIANARRVNPAIEAVTLSSKSGDGFDAWTDWIGAQRRAALRLRVEVLEKKLAAARGQLAP